MTALSLSPPLRASSLCVLTSAFLCRNAGRVKPVRLVARLRFTVMLLAFCSALGGVDAGVETAGFN